MRSCVFGLVGILLVFASCMGSAADALPQRESGFWEVTVVDPESSSRSKPVLIRECTSTEVDAQLLLGVAPAQENCDPPVVRTLDAGWTVETMCRVHGHKLDTAFAFEGDFVTSYTGRYESQNLDGCAGHSAECPKVRSFEGRRLGACPAGMGPGDVLLPNGLKVNVLDSSRRIRME